MGCGLWREHPVEEVDGVCVQDWVVFGKYPPGELFAISRSRLPLGGAEPWGLDVKVRDTGHKDLE